MLSGAPPDVSIAVGPTHIVETTNVKAMIFTRAGALLSTTSLATFFSATSGYKLTDPHVLFDGPSGRFFLVMVGYNDTTNTGAWWIAVSTSSNPTGTWNTWQYTEPGTFPDFPAIGINDDKFVLSDNGFSLPGLTTFQGTQFFVFNKADLIGGASVPRNAFAGLNLGHFTIQPAQSLSSSTTIYMASNDFATSFTFWQVNGLPGVSTVTTATSTLAFGGTTTPPSAVQLGSVRPIDTGDYRFLQTVWIDAKLWISGNTGCVPSGDSTTRSCAHFVQVNTATPAVIQDFSFGQASSYYYFPAIALDSAENLTTIFSRSSSAESAGLRYASRLASDPVNTLQGSVLLKAGNGPYTCTFCATRNRWGDFFGAALDPVDTAKIWIAGEYAKVTTAPACGGCTTGDQWGTYVAQVQVTSPLTPCTAVALSPSPASPQAPGTSVLWTAVATGCTSPQFRFFVFNGATGWTIAQEWSSSATFSWNTTGLAAGSYTIEAWVRADTTGTYQAVSPDVPYTLR